jgi:hypothetical protein
MRAERCRRSATPGDSSGQPGPGRRGPGRCGPCHCHPTRGGRRGVPPAEAARAFRPRPFHARAGQGRTLGAGGRPASGTDPRSFLTRRDQCRRAGCTPVRERSSADGSQNRTSGPPPSVSSRRRRSKSSSSAAPGGFPSGTGGMANFRTMEADICLTNASRLLPGAVASQEPRLRPQNRDVPSCAWGTQIDESGGTGHRARPGRPKIRPGRAVRPPPPLRRSVPLRLSRAWARGGSPPGDATGAGVGPGARQGPGSGRRIPRA